MFRFQNYFRFDNPAPFLTGELEPRLNQILSPLSVVMDEEDAREALRAFAKESR